MTKPPDLGLPLPDTLEGNPTVSFCMTIPNAPEYVQAFWGTIWELGNAWNWEKIDSEDERRQIAAQVWRDTLQVSRQDFEAGQGCNMTTFRFTEECGLEYSNDGVTWIPVDDWTGFAPDCFTGPQGETGAPGAPGAPGLPGEPGSPGEDGTINESPPPPTFEGTPDELCNAANYLADQLIALIDGVIDDLATLDALQILEALLIPGGWRSSVLYMLIGALEAAPDDWADILSDLTANRDDLVCQLYLNDLDQTTAKEWVLAFWPGTSVTRDALAQSIDSVTDGKWSQWIFLGSLQPGATDCGAVCVPSALDCGFTGDILAQAFTNGGEITDVRFITAQHVQIRVTYGHDAGSILTQRGNMTLEYLCASGAIQDITVHMEGRPAIQRLEAPIGSCVASDPNDVGRVYMSVGRSGSGSPQTMNPDDQADYTDYSAHFNILRTLSDIRIGWEGCRQGTYGSAAWFTAVIDLEVTLIDGNPPS